MENFNQLQALINEKQNIDEFIKRVKTIGFVGAYSGSKNHLAIIDSSNNRYNFGGIEKIIGEEKLKLIVEQFEGLLSVELHRVKQAKENELSNYKIIVDAANS
jgi:hypothetical protein